MQVRETDGQVAVVEQEGVTRRIRVDFTPNVGVGDYVLVHAGIAIEKVDAEQAAETLRLIKEIADAPC
jgi:hydrogenase expression/formation protein HypC